MRDKRSTLKIPRGYASVRVLFHIDGISSSLETDGFFYRIINITEFVDSR